MPGEMIEFPADGGTADGGTGDGGQITPGIASVEPPGVPCTVATDLLILGSGFERLVDEGLSFVVRQHHDLHLRCSLANHRDRVDPRQAGHGDVEQNHMWLQLADLLHRLARIPRVTDDLERWYLPQQRAEGRAQDGLIVDQVDPNHRTRAIACQEQRDADACE